MCNSNDLVHVQCAGLVKQNRSAETVFHFGIFHLFHFLTSEYSFVGSLYNIDVLKSIVFH